MPHVRTGEAEIKELARHGFSPRIAVVLDDENNVTYVQFNSQGSIQDVWDGVPLGQMGFVPTRRKDGSVGPAAVFRSRPRDQMPAGVFRSKKPWEMPVGIFRSKRPGDMPVGVFRSKRRREMPVGGVFRSRPKDEMPAAYVSAKFGDPGLPMGTSSQIRAADGRFRRYPDARAFGGDGQDMDAVASPIELGTSDASENAPITVAFSKGEAAKNGKSVTVTVTLRELTGDGTFKEYPPTEAKIMIDQPLMDEDDEIGAVQSVAEFRTAIDGFTGLSLEQRAVLVEQAMILIGDIYAHLPLKRAMHSIDPVQRLRLLQQQLTEMDDQEFYAELLDVFKELRDLHTNLTLPFPFGSQIAFLGVMVERFFTDGVPRYIVSKIAGGLNTDDDFQPGVEITHWNGMPMEAAIARNADKEAGSNIPSRMARGLENLTLRSLRSSLVPDEDWVDLTYVKDGQVRETRLHWLVFDNPDEIREALNNGLGFVDSTAARSAYNLGVDERQRLFGRAKRKLFVGDKTKAEQAEEKAQGSTADHIDIEIPGDRSEISAKIIQGPDNDEYGYIRLWSFFMEDFDIDGFVSAFIDLLENQMPANGLIIDVRGNGGGFIIAAEFLLQLMTFRRITPQPAQFIATSQALDLASKVEDMQKWVPSLKQAVSTGALYSKALPISDPNLVNLVGQIYFGPVVLITDAFCYSACDMFAAGFQDHKIGTILGVDERTGAGGANVLTHDALLGDWFGGPLEELPLGADMRVSLRRTMRVGDQAGDPVEDLGVIPDFLHNMTLDDLMDSNVDLLNHAISILRDGTPRKFDVHFGIVDSMLSFDLDVQGIDQVDLYLNGRPILSAVADASTISFEIDPPNAGDQIELLGFSTREEGPKGILELVARRLLHFQ